MKNFIFGLFIIFFLISCSNNMSSDKEVVGSENSNEKLDTIHQVGAVSLNDLKTLFSLKLPDQKDLLYKSGFIEIDGSYFGRQKDSSELLEGYSETINIFRMAVDKKRVVEFSTKNRGHYLKLRESAKKSFKFDDQTPDSEAYIDKGVEYLFTILSQKGIPVIYYVRLTSKE